MGDKTYGDEAAIHEIAVEEAQKREAETQNDINNGYATINGKRMLFDTIPFSCS